MNAKKIIHNNQLLALVIRSGDWEPGLHFVSGEEDFIQAGFWGYDKDKQLAPHIHLQALRQVQKTQEVVFVKRGRMRADVFSDQGEKVESVELGAGDTGIFLNGGHGYEILENGTQVLEVKNGPYVGPDQDRKRI